MLAIEIAEHVQLRPLQLAADAATVHVGNRFFLRHNSRTLMQPGEKIRAPDLTTSIRQAG